MLALCEHVPDGIQTAVHLQCPFRPDTGCDTLTVRQVRARCLDASVSKHAAASLVLVLGLDAGTPHESVESAEAHRTFGIRINGLQARQHVHRPLRHAHQVPTCPTKFVRAVGVCRLVLVLNCLCGYVKDRLYHLIDSSGPSFGRPLVETYQPELLGFVKLDSLNGAT